MKSKNFDLVLAGAVCAFAAMAGVILAYLFPFPIHADTLMKISHQSAYIAEGIPHSSFVTDAGAIAIVYTYPTDHDPRIKVAYIGTGGNVSELADFGFDYNDTMPQFIETQVRGGKLYIVYGDWLGELYQGVWLKVVTLLGGEVFLPRVER